MTDCLSISRAAALLGVHPATLRRWEQAGRVAPRRINARGDRRFVLAELNELLADARGDRPGTRAAPYVRVFGRGDQLPSLAARELELRTAAASRSVEVVNVFSDVGSGLSECRRGLAALLRAARSGAFSRAMVTREDRLARLGVTWLRELPATSGVGLVVLNEKGAGPAESELVADFVALVASFSGRLYGQRSAAARRRPPARVDADETA
jgi:predicted site-specific integrase-resolvase